LPLPPELALRFFFPPLGADVLLRFCRILPALLFDAAPVVHCLLVLLRVFVVHLSPLCSAEPAGLHPRPDLRPSEINRPPTTDRPAAAGDHEQLVGARVLDQLIRFDERAADLVHVRLRPFDRDPWENPIRR
jgi:hypothetical protein